MVLVEKVSAARRHYLLGHRAFPARLSSCAGTLRAPAFQFHYSF
jgi:hypothetical protein